jgi:hypothetical protein
MISGVLIVAGRVHHLAMTLTTSRQPGFLYSSARNSSGTRKIIGVAKIIQRSIAKQPDINFALTNMFTINASQ